MNICFKPKLQVICDYLFYQTTKSSSFSWFNDLDSIKYDILFIIILIYIDIRSIFNSMK